MEDTNVGDVWRCLDRYEKARVVSNGSDVFIRTVEDGSKLFFATSVYKGTDYLPRSVRDCLKGDIPFDGSNLSSFLTLDENSFSIFLNYFGVYEEVSDTSLSRTLNEFTRQAMEWRLYLDEKDRHDRIHTRVR